MRRVVEGEFFCSPPGGPLEMVEIYASRWHLDREEALESIPNTYEGMLSKAIFEAECEECI